MTTEPTDEQIRLILIESYERDRALQDARHAEELAAYELTVKNLRAAQGRDKHWHDTAWNRGHQMGMAANRDIARQATEALAKERAAHAETNRMMTEALMQAEAAQGVPNGFVLVPVEPSIAACINGSDAAGRVVDGYQCAAVYRAMLAAAPQPTPEESSAVAQPEHPATNRWNIERDGADLLICFDDHDKGEKCEYKRFVPVEKAQPEPAPTSVSLSKRAKLEADGYVVNGVALMHPETRQRVLLDYCGFVGWYGPIRLYGPIPKDEK